MLSENDQHAVQTFQSRVIVLEQIISKEFERTTFKTEFSSFQNLFQAEIQAIQTDDYRVRSVLVEIDKQMRLLKMDAMFLQTARQSETAQQRVNQLRDRLQLLKSYCDALLGSTSD
jgi:hypothetical protein